MTLDPIFAQHLSNELVWVEERGMGHYPVCCSDREVYNDAYWDKYVAYADTELGRQLNGARIALLERHVPLFGRVTDIGIGCGQFVQAARDRSWLADGFDVNPRGVQWLQERSWMASDPYRGSMFAATFWDVLEHLENPSAVLANVLDTVLVSLPIFRNLEHLVSSRHFRKDEHRWYWTRKGFTRYMEECGFRLLEWSKVETHYGREDIETFAFRRD